MALERLKMMTEHDSHAHRNLTELYREEKKEAGDRGGQKDKRGK